MSYSTGSSGVISSGLRLILVDESTGTSGGKSGWWKALEPVGWNIGERGIVLELVGLGGYKEREA